MDILRADASNCKVTGYEMEDWDSFPDGGRDICLHQLVPTRMVVRPDSEHYLHPRHSFPWYFGEQTCIRLATGSNLGRVAGYPEFGIFCVCVYICR